MQGGFTENCSGDNPSVLDKGQCTSNCATWRKKKKKKVEEKFPFLLPHDSEWPLYTFIFLATVTIAFLNRMPDSL